MAENALNNILFVDPALVLAGDPTVALGAGMANLGVFPTVRLTQRNPVRRGSDRMGHQLADGAYTRGGSLGVELTGYLNQVSIMHSLMNNIVPVGTNGGFNVIDRTVRIKPATLCIIPISELEDEADPIDAAGVYWIPAFQEDSDFQTDFDGTTDGDDANSVYTIGLVSLKRYRDQDDTPLPPGTRQFFRGSPNVDDEGSGEFDGPRDLGWSLPPDLHESLDVDPFELGQL